jgi:hypothetical protein
MGTPITHEKLQGITVQTFGENFYSTNTKVSSIINDWRAKLNKSANQFDDIYIVDVDVDFVKEIPEKEVLDPKRNYFIVNRGNGRLREEFAQKIYSEYCKIISSQGALRELYVYPYDVFATLYYRYKELFGPIKFGLTRYSFEVYMTSSARLEQCIRNSFGKILTKEFLLYIIEQFRKHFIISEQLDIPRKKSYLEDASVEDNDLIADELIVLAQYSSYDQQFKHLLESMDNNEFTKNQQLNQYIKNFYYTNISNMTDRYYRIDSLSKDRCKNILSGFVHVFSPNVLEDNELHLKLQMMGPDNESRYYNGMKKDGSIQYNYFVNDAIYNVETQLLNMHPFATDKSNANEFYEAMLILYTLFIKLGDDF